MEIVSYQKKYKQTFIDLNLVWLNKFFKVEPQDLEMLNGIDKLIDKGAQVFFAIEEGEPIATCMICPLENNVFELCKLATDERYQGKGAGSAVIKACLDYACSHGATKVKIVSNRILEPAIHLYKKFGFQEVPIEYMEYDRVDIQLEYTP